jgi:PAS domain S-box-containing protein
LNIGTTNSNPGSIPRQEPMSPEYDGHVVQFYTDDSFLFDVLASYLGAAVAMGDAAVIIATEAHRVGLEQRLQARGIDISGAVMQGRFLHFDARATLHEFLVNGKVDEELFATRMDDILRQARRATLNEGSRIAVFGEMVALLWADGKPEEAVKLEQFWNKLAERYFFNLVCGYPITGFDRERHIQPFLQICSQHSSVIPSESYIGLEGEDERLRRVASLQQRTQVLEKELALRVSEQQLRLLVEAVQDYAIFMLDTEGYVQSWNTGAERIKGYKAAEIIGKHFSVFYPEQELKNRKPWWELELAAKDGRFEDEGWRVRKDGSRFWANVIITAVRDHNGNLVGFGKVTRDFTERMRSQAALQKEVADRREAEQRLRELSLHLLRTQDEERKRIGRDLHDSLGQYLVALKMKLDVLARTSKDEEKISECIRLVKDSIKEVRTISYLLYPPMLEESGLHSAIQWYVDGFTERSGLRTTLELDPRLSRLPRDIELALFRVLQEALTNVHRHSGSKVAHIRLSREGETVVLEVRDKGRGIPAKLLEDSPNGIGAVGIGLRGMKERMRELGGALELVSTAKGTTVTATAPLGNLPQEPRVEQNDSGVLEMLAQLRNETE